MKSQLVIMDMGVTSRGSNGLWAQRGPVGEFLWFIHCCIPLPRTHMCQAGDNILDDCAQLSI